MVGTKVLIKDNNKYKLSVDTLFTGKLQINAQGNGYISSENREFDIFVSNTNLNRALDSDIVTATFHKRESGKYEGTIVDIVERTRKKLCGNT